MTNPYAQLARQTRTLLRTESEMSPSERERFSWSVRAEIGTTHATVIKGGANTLLVLLGERRSRPLYPVQALQLLDELRAQAHPLYARARVAGSRAMILPWTHRLRDALRAHGREGDRLYGYGEDGMRVLTHVMRRAVSGDLKWIERRAS